MSGFRRKNGFGKRGRGEGRGERRSFLNVTTTCMYNNGFQCTTDVLAVQPSTCSHQRAQTVAPLPLVELLPSLSKCTNNIHYNSQLVGQFVFILFFLLFSFGTCAATPDYARAFVLVLVWTDCDPPPPPRPAFKEDPATPSLSKMRSAKCSLPLPSLPSAWKLLLLPLLRRLVVSTGMVVARRGAEAAVSSGVGEAVRGVGAPPAWFDDADAVDDGNDASPPSCISLMFRSNSALSFSIVSSKVASLCRAESLTARFRGVCFSAEAAAACAR